MPFPTYWVDETALLNKMLKQIIMLISQVVAITKRSIIAFFCEGRSMFIIMNTKYKTQPHLLGMSCADGTFLPSSCTCTVYLLNGIQHLVELSIFLHQSAQYPMTRKMLGKYSIACTNNKKYPITMRMVICSTVHLNQKITR